MRPVKQGIRAATDEVPAVLPTTGDPSGITSLAMLPSQYRRSSLLGPLTLALGLLIPCFPGIAAAAPPSGTAAPDPAKRKEAEAVFRRAIKLFEDQRWDAALTEFRASLALFPTRAATLNTSICLEKLGRFDEAVTVLELGLGQTTWGPDDAAAITKKLETLRTLVGEVTVTANVDGADVLVDSVVRGTTPLTGPLRIGSGSHRIRVEKPGHFPFERSFDLAGKQELTLTATLSPMQVAVTTNGPAKEPEKVPEKPVEAPQGSASPLRTVGVAGMGLGVASIAVGGIFLGLREATVTDMKNSGCSGVIPAGSLADKCLDLDDKRNSQRTIGLIGLGAGVVLAGVGATLFFTAPARAEKASASRPHTTCGLSFNGVACLGTF